MDADRLHPVWSCNTLEEAKTWIESHADAPFHLKNFVGGAYVSSDIHTYIDSIDPKTGLVFAKVPCTQPNDVDIAIQTAKDAFPSWSKTTRAERSEYLFRVAKLIRSKREHFAVWESIDQGKTLDRARIEVDRAIANFE